MKGDLPDGKKRQELFHLKCAHNGHGPDEWHPTADMFGASILLKPAEPVSWGIWSPSGSVLKGDHLKLFCTKTCRSELLVEKSGLSSPTRMQECQVAKEVEHHCLG